MRKLLIVTIAIFSLIAISPGLHSQNSDSCKAYVIQLSYKNAPELPADHAKLLPYNFYGICWNGNPEDNLKFARQMGYKYVMYQKGMENSSLASDLYFYLESPDYQVYGTLGIDRTLSLKKEYTSAQKRTYQSYFALKNNALPFPGNMASGWFSGDGFSVEPDWQQQRVVDYFAARVAEDAKKKERPEKNFLFGGVAWDVPQLSGDFYGDGKQVTLAFWNRKDSSALFPGTSHDYKTYSEGKAAYYTAIKNVIRNSYPGRQLTYIFEPYNYYDSWFKGLETLSRDEQMNLMDDAMIIQECGVTKWASGTEFVDDARVRATGLLTRNHSGSTTPDNHDLASNKLIAAKAAINGAWFGWYGRFSGSGDRVPMKNITEVPHWLQLIRVVANWDNLNGVPLPERKWDGLAYSSRNSRIDDNIIYSRQPETRKLFVTFLNGRGEIFLNPGERIVSVKRADAFFCEADDGSNDLKISGNRISLKK